MRYRVDGGAWVEIGPGETSATDARMIDAGQVVHVEVQVRNASGWSAAGEATGAPVAQGGA